MVVAVDRRRILSGVHQLSLLQSNKKPAAGSAAGALINGMSVVPKQRQ
jgi:hypothetical protein